MTELGGKQDLIDIVDAWTGSGRSCSPPTADQGLARLPRQPHDLDALLDRIVNNAHRLTLAGESMRRRTRASLVKNMASEPAPTSG